MEGLANKFGRWFRKSSPTLLSCLGAVGVVATTVLAVKATPKAHRKLLLKGLEVNEDVAHPENYRELTTKEAIQTVWKDYIPAAAVGIGTMICIFGANGLNRRQQAAITGAYVLLDQAYREYQKKAKELYGEEGDEKIREEIIKEKEIDFKPSGGETLVFYEDTYGKFFERTMAEVIDAEYQLNRIFALEGEASLNKFYELLGLEPMKYGDLLGWNQETNDEFYNYPWIEFEHKLITLDDGLECYYINMTYPPFLFS